jgi:hypothetical protein
VTDPYPSSRDPNCMSNKTGPALARSSQLAQPKKAASVESKKWNRGGRKYKKESARARERTRERKGRMEGKRAQQRKARM